MRNPVETFAAATTVTAGILGIWALATKVAPVVRRIIHLIDDMLGSPARPGVPEKPGVMARLAIIESDAKKARENTQPNGGSSAYDRLVRTIETIHANQETFRSELHEIRAELSAQARVSAIHRTEAAMFHEAVTRAGARQGFEIPPWPVVDPEDVPTIALSPLWGDDEKGDQE